MKRVDHIGSVFLRKVILRMKELGLSRTALARRMKVSRSYVTKVLSGDVSFTFRTASKLARALQMDFFPDLVVSKDSHAAGGRAVGDGDSSSSSVD